MTRHRVQLLQGNRTVRRLMAEALEASGFEVSADADERLADLLVLDVDSGLDLGPECQTRYVDEDRPVLVCGLRNSREHYPEVAWLHRPFSPDGFVAECRELLGLTKTPGLDEDSTPQTQRLTLEAAEQLEEELGLARGTLDLGEDDSEAELDLSLDDTNNLGGDEVPEFLELETSNSIELDVDDLEEVSVPVGGALFGEIARETVRVEDLEWSTPDEGPPIALRSATLNQTMPDAPAVMAPDDVANDDSLLRALTEHQVGDEASSPRRSDSQPGALPHTASELERQIEGVSQVLARSWGRIGLAARPRDRANHIRGVLSALVSQGIKAASAEVERIPNARGFSGDLAALGLVDLLETARDRRLRGRLELSVDQDDFVLYLEQGRLIDLESLSGDDDQLLLDILLEEGAIALHVHEELERSSLDELAPPVQMRLRQEELVTQADLLCARKERVIRVCRPLLDCHRGSFAFVVVEEGSGAVWPVEGLAIDLDQLLEADGCGRSEAETAVNPDHGEAFLPQGFEIDDQLTPTIEVADADSALVGAGPADAGPADAGPADAGPADAGLADAGPTDAGPANAGPTDAGPTESGRADTAQPDSELSDLD